MTAPTLSPIGQMLAPRAIGLETSDTFLTSRRREKSSCVCARQLMRLGSLEQIVEFLPDGLFETPWIHVARN